MAKLLRVSRTGDEGISLVMVMIVVTIVFALGGTWLSYADHESSASSYDRRRQQAVDAANAGLAVAASQLSRNASYSGAGLTSFPGGSAAYEVSVVNGAGTYMRVITAKGYAPTKSAANAIVRVMRQQVELDPVGFQYAVLSETSIANGSSPSIIGDIYANGNISLGNAQSLVGNVYTQGSLTTGSNQTITGNIYASTNVVVSSNSSEIKGSVYAGGFITTGGTINDRAQAGGVINGSGCAKVKGTCAPNTPPPPIPVQHLPAFVWDPNNYSSVAYPLTGAAFVTAVNGVNTSGVYKVPGAVSFPANGNLYLTGDLTIVADGAIALPRRVENRTSPARDVQLSVISTTGGTITPPNNFTIPTTVKTLMFTTGAFDTRNSSTFTGALYTGSFLNGANASVTFSPLDDRGFSWAAANPQSFLVRNVSTREISGA